MFGMSSEVLLAISTPAAGVFGWIARTLWSHLRRNTEWELSEVVSLRKALDRLRRRENAYATGFEIVLIALPPSLSPEQHYAVQRARQLFETALIPLESDGRAMP